MKLFEYLLKGIGSVWSFVATIATIGFISAIAFFGLTVFMPDQVLKAIEIIKNLIP